ncbi:TatD family hydrolase [Candidatus Saccharibacteria bacterium]|nr:TatD family hydrolase [Candidatus Saccharibacteria bacterium]
MDYFVDSHCHMHDKEFYTPEEQEILLEKAYQANVQKMIFIGTNHADSYEARDFAFAHDGKREHLFWSYGIHPNELDKPREVPDFSSDKPIAIGEVGLDYHYGSGDKTEQFQLLNEMCQLAIDNDLPLIFHVREAFNDFLYVTKNFTNLRGVVHSFSDKKRYLRESLERGFYIGVNGMATYSTLPLPPLDRTLIETDAPFLAPKPYRGSTNQSGFIPEIGKWLAEQHETTLDEVMKTTTENCTELFKF